MHVGAGEQLDHFRQHVLQELEGAFLDVEQGGVDAPFVEHVDLLAGHAEFRIRGHRGLRMPGGVDLRDDGDVAFRCIAHHVADLVLGVVAAIRTRFPVAAHAAIARGNAAAADLGQLRISLDLDAPALVVGQVPVEGVELVQRHRVEQLLDFIHGLEMARRIQHQSAPGEARRVVDMHGGNAKAVFRVRRQQLPKRHRAVEQAARIARGHHDALRIGIQRVAFRIGADGLGIDAEVDRALVVASFLDFQLQSVGPGDKARELLRDDTRLGIQHPDLRGRAHEETTRMPLHRCRRGDQRRFRQCRAARCHCTGWNRSQRHQRHQGNTLQAVGNRHQVILAILSIRPGESWERRPRRELLLAPLKSSKQRQELAAGRRSHVCRLHYPDHELAIIIPQKNRARTSPGP